MIEELFVIKDGVKRKVDLNTPSGISLVFKSNLFCDISNITCSHSYTFKLPITLNNRIIFESAEDVRCTSRMIRKRLKAEFVQNGIPLFNDANLYIDSSETSYNAIMTFRVIDGFQSLKDDDISIKQLGLSVKTTFGPCNSKIEEYDNTSDCVRPLYNAGLKYVSNHGYKDNYNTYSVFPLPAIPVYRLIQLINEKYGTKFNFGTSYKYGEESNCNDIIKLGVIPCISANSYEDVNVASLYLTIPTSDIINEIQNVVKSPINDFGTIDETKFRVNKDSSGKLESITNISGTALNVEVDGMFYAKFMYRPDGYNWDVSLNGTAGSKPSLGFFIGNESVGSIEGKYPSTSSGGILCWSFKFSKEDGYDRLSFTIPDGETMFMAFSCDLNNFSVNEIIECNITRIYASNNVDNIKWYETENKAGSFEFDLISNLPDISCLTLIKSLFYMIGAFPAINDLGEIVPLYYSSIKDNLQSGNCIDWSSKITSQVSVLPSKSIYSVSGFAQRNYYLMKNDNLDSNGSDDENDIYETGIGCINVNNEIIDKDKTIVQLPFYAPYIKNKKAPHLDTGNTMKFWYLENDEVKTKEAKPCFGIITPLVQYSDETTTTGLVWMSMKVWNGFPEIQSESSYSYVQEIMKSPIVITDNLNLSELDLMKLDYSVPVYIEKYNSYFAIVSITRDSKGICKCELIKLP